MIYPCDNHYGTPSTQKCNTCHGHFCDECLVANRTNHICIHCKKIGFRKKLALGAGIFLFLTIFTFLLSPRARLNVRSLFLTMALNKKSCDTKQFYDLAKLDFALDHDQKALQLTNHYLNNCGENYDIRRMQLNFHIEAKHYESALKDVDVLLDEDPFDTSYWAWKAGIYENMSNFDLAIQCYRESIKLEPTLMNIPMNLVSLYRKTKRFCEGYQELERYMNEYPQISEENKFRSMLTTLSELGHCDRDYSKGETSIRFSPGKSSIRAVVTFNDSTQGMFLIDTGASEVMLTKSFSKKVETIGDKKAALFSTANGITRGLVTYVRKISVKGASSTNVPINISEMDMPGIDGLLGMSFLSRFQMEIDNEKGLLKLKQKNFPTSK